MIGWLMRTVLGSNRVHLDDDARASLRAVLDATQYEMLPLKSAHAQMGFLPSGSQVSVTASPTGTLEATLDLCAELTAAGHHAIPHLSARMVRDEAHLRALLARIDDLGITEAFVIGGDAPDPGDYFDAGALLEAMATIEHGLEIIGIAAYPEGHHIVDDRTALEALRLKQPYASYMTTQMCFDADAIASWIANVRSEGITLPVVIGVAGVADRVKLLGISARIGVGQSIRYLSKNRGIIGQFISPGGYAPDPLLEELAPTMQDPRAQIIGLHIFTFNQVENTKRWRSRYLERL